MSNYRHKRKEPIRDSIVGITYPAIKRLAYQAGIKSMSKIGHEQIRTVIKMQLESILGPAITRMKARGAVTLSLQDVLQSIEDAHGTKMMYGAHNKIKPCKAE